MAQPASVIWLLLRCSSLSDLSARVRSAGPPAGGQALVAHVAVQMRSR